MLRGIKLVTVIISMSATLGLAAAQGGANQDVIRMDFLLNWTISGDHAPYYVALDKGWYDEVGLDVNIILGQGSGFTVQSVDTGRAHMGIADAPVAVAGRAEGADVTIVGIIFDKHPNSMFFWSDADITEPQDLVGMTVAVPASDGHRVMWPAFAQLIGVDPNSVEFVNIAPAAKVAALSARRADVVFELYTGKPFMEKAIPPEQLGNILWADYGFDLYAHSYIASNEVIANNPEMIRRFLDASYRAWEFTLQNPEEAIAILAEYHPINRDDYLANLMLVREFFMTDRYRDEGIGYIDLERAQVTVDMVEDYQGIDVDFTASEMFDGSFLPDPMYRFEF
jgi:NitT/TauT family transport system substrate-binding protein